MALNFEYLDPEEIIGTEDFRFVEAFLRDTGRAKVGWHYFVDLAWIYSRVKDLQKGANILDAGGGSGPTQFLLAELGFNVTNIDLFHREPSAPMRKRYGMEVRSLPSFSPTMYSDQVENWGGWSALGRLKRRIGSTRLVKDIRGALSGRRHDIWRVIAGLEGAEIGKLTLLRGNLRSVPEVASNSFDAVVSLSSLEHVPSEHLSEVVSEISRLLKPGGRWMVTTSGTERADTWFHEPSKGNCFSEAGLLDYFGAEKHGEQNPEQILRHYRDSAYLQENLAGFYRKSGNSGMPWGKWNPTYIPVGIFGTNDESGEVRAAV